MHSLEGGVVTQEPEQQFSESFPIGRPRLESKFLVDVDHVYVRGGVKLTRVESVKAR